jgi:hypothetical protein
MSKYFLHLAYAAGVSSGGLGIALCTDSFQHGVGAFLLVVGFGATIYAIVASID